MTELGISLIIIGVVILSVAIIKSIVTHDPLKAFWGDDCYDEGGMFSGETPVLKRLFRPTFWKRILIIISPIIIICGIIILLVF